MVHNSSRLPSTLPGRQEVLLVNYGGGDAGHMPVRMELLTHADGVFSESGDVNLNAIGLSTIAMPAIGWTYDTDSIDDDYMQRHLRMGVFPMAPVYGADHSLSDKDAAGMPLRYY